MSTKNPYVHYFTSVKSKAKALEKLGLTDDDILTDEQQRALDEFKGAVEPYLLGGADNKVNKRGLTTLTRNGFRAHDISGQPSNEDSDGAYHTGATIQVGDLTVTVEQDDC
ncbi:hypothetical protein [Pseudomonas congelans]|uniref:hypothetical protein n=1 Tax=Pseudomonas congelans TaxID=200452 RepID=UPI0004E2A1D2|nr:hypothetical protein [Pseudomonas congelans]KFE47993.1 hypothetical protein IV03_07995 [Pseudomonas congelans]